MSTFKKRILGFILCVAIVLSSISIGLLGNVTSSLALEDEIEFTKWDTSNSLPTVAGDYYLDCDVTLSDTWTVPAGTINLDLNGKVIKLEGENKKFVISIGSENETTLNIYDNSTDVEHYFEDVLYYDTDENSNYWVLNDTLTGEDIKHTVDCGVITSDSSIGVSVYSLGTFNMYGGAVCGNTGSDAYASGVNVESGTFNMYGGTICGNYNMSAGGVDVSCCYDTPDVKGTFNMHGGVIENNCANFFSGGVLVIYGTFNMYDGNIKNNFSINGGGVGVIALNGSYTEDCVFNMYGGVIEENEAWYGGGVDVGSLVEGFYFCPGKFVMHGGEIRNNHAIEFKYEDIEESYSFGGIGGGVFALDGALFVADGGIIDGNIADRAGGGVYIAEENSTDPYYCVAEGTLITLTDGTTTAIENLEIGDTVRVFDHETGELSSAKIFYLEKSENVKDGVVTLHFTNDIDITIIGGHSFYNKDSDKYKYVTITPDNVEDYIGKQFYNADGDCWETLNGYDVVTSGIDSYSIVTEKTLNVVTNGMLSCGDAIYTVLINVFDFDENQKYINMADDIEEYELLDFAETSYATKETFDALNLKYLKIAIGKGLITEEQIAMAGDYQADRDSNLVRRTGVYFGGDIKVTNNTMGEDTIDNVFLWGDENANKIKIGSGESGNGVAEPENGMSVGITMKVIGATDAERTIGIVAINGVENYTNYFFADSVSQRVVYDEGNMALIDLYAINITETENGKITLPEYADGGEVVVVEVTPDNGYKIKSLKYNNGTEDVEIVETDGIYSFVMPENLVAIFAEFEEIPATNKGNVGLIITLSICALLLLLIVIYLLGYFLLYRRGKLDERKIKVIYKILPRGDKNVKKEENKE